MAVKVMSAHGARPADASSAEQEIKSKAYAAQACSQVVRVFAHCIKHQQLCLVMLPCEQSLVTLVEGELRPHIRVCVSDLKVEHPALCTSLSTALMFAGVVKSES